MNVRILAGAAACLFAISFSASAADETGNDAVAIAEAYLAAYSTFDTSQMAPFYVDDAVFSDPTSRNVFAEGQSFEFNGKDAILKGLGDYAAGYREFSVSYDVERRYESSGVVVFVAQLTYNSVSKNGNVSSGTSPIVTAIEVRDGKVVSHTDYYDYRENAVEFE